MPAIPGVSLGVEFHGIHRAAAVRGSMATVTAVCIDRNGQYWRWRVEVVCADDGETLAVCELGFVSDIDRARYQRRLALKLAARSPLVVWWLRICDGLSLAVVAATPVQLAYAWHHWPLATEALVVVVWLITRLTGLLPAINDWFTVRKVPANRHSTGAN
jgi:hypothetical protein